MNDQQRYLFDLQGYIVLKNIVPPETIQACNSAMDRLETMPQDEWPGMLSLGTLRTEKELYLSNILEADERFLLLMEVPEVLKIVREISGDSYRLNHTYGIWRWGVGGFTPMHMGNTPMIDKCQYRSENGQIISTLTKAVFPMLDANAEDGCFAVIPGSHKSSFPRPYSSHPEENPPLIPVPANAGDCIIFTEALAHASTVKTSSNRRRTLYYCYSVGWMPDWGGQGLHFSDRVLDKLNDSQREIVRLK